MNTIVMEDIEEEEPDLFKSQFVEAVGRHWRRILGIAIVGGLLGYGVAFFVPPTFTARMTFISPQPQQSAAASALASLSALSSLAGVGGGVKSGAEQYIALMQSATVSNRIVARFRLTDVYETKLLVDARKRLAQNVRITAGKKDGLITVDVDDSDPDRAAAIANAYLDELHAMSNGLALTEAQQRRQFFEKYLETTRDKLTQAQQRLEASGFDAGALKTEPKSAAESYARIKAEMASTEVRLEAMRHTLTEQSPEVQRELATLSGLRAQLAAIEQPMHKEGTQDYTGAYREFKYQETLFEIYARQFELARLDESKEGTLFQVVDPATRPERRSAPKRTFWGAGAMLLTGLLACACYFVAYRRQHRSPSLAVH